MLSWQFQMHKRFCQHSELTKFDKQHPCGGHGALSVGGHALEVACVGGVQVADSEA